MKIGDGVYFLDANEGVRFVDINEIGHGVVLAALRAGAPVRYLGVTMSDGRSFLSRYDAATGEWERVEIDERPDER